MPGVGPLAQSQTRICIVAAPHSTVLGARRARQANTVNQPRARRRGHWDIKTSLGWFLITRPRGANQAVRRPTTRVRATRSWNARRSGSKKAGSKPSPRRRSTPRRGPCVSVRDSRRLPIVLHSRRECAEPFLPMVCPPTAVNAESCASFNSSRNASSGSAGRAPRSLSVPKCVT